MNFEAQLKLIFQGDESIDEVFVNGIRSLNILKGKHLTTLSSPFVDNSSLIRSIQEFSLTQGLRLDPNFPATGGSLDGGQYRWHAIIPPASSQEAVFSLRRHRFDSIKLSHFTKDEGISSKLKHILKSHDPVLFCGETGSGKSTLLLTILKMYCLEERVIIIEDLEELPHVSPFWIFLKTHPTGIQGKGLVGLPFLLSQTLRLKPDRVVIGEMRSLESINFFETLLTGHSGSLSTFHAHDIDDVKQRLIYMFSQQGQNNEKWFRTLLEHKCLWGVFLENHNKPTIRCIARIV